MNDKPNFDLSAGAIQNNYIHATPYGNDPINTPFVIRPMTADEVRQEQEREMLKKQKEYEQSEAFFVERMKVLIDMWDTEAAHGKADDLLCGFLRLNGHGDLVDAWEEVPKWYA